MTQGDNCDNNNGTLTMTKHTKLHSEMNKYYLNISSASIRWVTNHRPIRDERWLFQSPGHVQSVCEVRRQMGVPGRLSSAEDTLLQSVHASLGDGDTGLGPPLSLRSVHNVSVKSNWLNIDQSGCLLLMFVHDFIPSNTVRKGILSPLAATMFTPSINKSFVSGLFSGLNLG